MFQAIIDGTGNKIERLKMTLAHEKTSFIIIGVHKGGSRGSVYPLGIFECVF